MRKLLQITIGAFVAIHLSGCVHQLDEVSATIDSQQSATAANVCSVVTVSNHLRTVRKKTPTEPRVRMNILQYTYNYDVFATSDAASEYQNIRLGTGSKTINDIYQERVCRKVDRNNKCIRHEWRDEYRPVIKYGESSAISVQFNNLIGQATQVPSQFSFGLLNLYLGSNSIEREFKELDFVAPNMLPCYYAHLITLYNANVAPEGAVSSARTKTSDEVQASMDIASFPLLTETELDQLKTANGHLPIIRELQSTYQKRASALAKYLSDTAKGKDAAAFIASAIQNGNWSEAYSMARKKVSGDSRVSADEVLAVLPDASRVIGPELVDGFAQAIAQTLTLQAQIDKE